MRAGLMLAVVAWLGCRDGSDPVVPAGHDHAHTVAANVVSANATGLIQDVRRATARFHSTVQATKAGYAEASPCVAAPGLGGMGFHWVSDGLVDPVFDAAAPEAVLYAPTKNGRPELVAVEYIVIDVGQPAPTFGSQPFDVGGTPVPVAHWSLHVWLYRENPNGTFAPFNPAVSC
jgi:hypothetical protein